VCSLTLRKRAKLKVRKQFSFLYATPYLILDFAYGMMCSSPFLNVYVRKPGVTSNHIVDDGA